MTFHSMDNFYVQVLITLFIFGATHCTDPQCTIRGNNADCSNKEFFTVPTLQPTFKTLNLNGNRLNTLRSNSFSAASLLTNLSVASSHVSVVDKDAFGGLINLSSLDLSMNTIKTINQTFNANLKNLEYLYLQYNSISRIPKNALDHLVKLKKLNLAHNKLASIHPHAFNKLSLLTWIAIDHNNLVTANSSWFAPINKTLTFISLGHNPWQCDRKMCGFKIWTQSVKKMNWNPKMIEISCSHSNKTLKDFHTKTLCRGSIQEVKLGHDIILSCLDTTSRHVVWEYMKKSNTSHPRTIQKIVSNQKTTIKSGKLLLTGAEERDAGSYCCRDTSSDNEIHTPPGQFHTSPHCTVLKVKVPYTTKTSKSAVGGSGGTVAAVILLILAAVGGVSFWYFRRKRRSYGLLNDETVFQPSYDDAMEPERIHQRSTDENGLSEAYV